LFTRISLLESVVNNNLYKDSPKVAEWAGRLIARESVKKSVVPDFQQKYLVHIGQGEGFAGKLFRQPKRFEASKEVQLH